MNDSAFDALANEHRRTLLLALLDENPQDAAVHASEAVDAPKATHQLQTTMYHSHLPKLADHGFIEWNRDTWAVVKGPHFGEVRPLLECIDKYAES